MPILIVILIGWFIGWYTGRTTVVLYKIGALTTL